jgi:4-hydroxybutyrate dehydrogenase
MLPTISYMTDVIFGQGAVRELPAQAEKLEIRRPLVVTDRGLVAAGVVERVIGHIKSVSLFDRTLPNPAEAAVEQAAAQYSAEQCDGIIAVGGGSAIDLAKAAALRVTHPGPLPAYAAVENGQGRITSAIAPLIAVPTTSGSGSEVGRASLIVLNDGRKIAIISKHLLPKIAICDPELTRSLPPLLAAGCAMDAIAHCIEALLSPRFNPPADAIALDGLARAVSNVERAVHDPADDTACSEMMMASLQAGLCFQKGLGAVHALSHALGALQEPVLHHGTLNGVFLPAVLRFNEIDCTTALSRIRVALTIPETSGLDAFFARLQARLQLPCRLRDLGVCEAMLPGAAKAALQDLNHETNPRRATEADYAVLLQESF